MGIEKVITKNKMVPKRYLALYFDISNSSQALILSAKNKNDTQLRVSSGGFGRILSLRNIKVFWRDHSRKYNYIDYKNKSQ